MVRNDIPFKSYISASSMHSEPRKHRFCVIGAGVIGMSSAYVLAREFPGCSIKVLYAECSPNTTSNDGFGFVSHRKRDEYDGPKTSVWSKDTLDHCQGIYQQSPEFARAMGINATTGYAYEEKIDGNLASGGAPHTFTFFREINADERKELRIETRYKELSKVYEHKLHSPEEISVFKFGTFAIDGHSYLPWLKKELELMVDRNEISSFQFEQRYLKNISEVINGPLDLIINCSGVGAAELANDSKVTPIRGQYLLARTRNPVGTFYGNHTFICPKPGRVCLGSVYQIGRRDKQLDPRDREDIITRCRILCPELRNCEIIKEKVGIRPGRIGGPRVELEMTRYTKPNGDEDCIPVIHNYGHGSKGFIQHWGCALEVKKLAREYLTSKSKL